MRFVQANVVACHIWLWHCTFLSLLLPERENWTPYHSPLFTSTRSNVLNSSPVSFFWWSTVATPWWVGLCLVVSPWDTGDEGNWRGGSRSNQDDMGLLPAVSFAAGAATCVSFLSTAFLFIMQSLQMIHESIIICKADCSSEWNSLISVIMRVHSISHEGSGFFGTTSGFGSVFSCSSFSSTSASASPIGRVHDQDRRELSLSLLSWLPWLWRVACGRDCCWFWGFQSVGTACWDWLVIDYFVTSLCEILGYVHENKMKNLNEVTRDGKKFA